MSRQPVVSRRGPHEAPGLGADTVQALDGPEDGVQRYAMWRCGR
jgi:hypothetical protein